jgi:hypothetical protein
MALKVLGSEAAMIMVLMVLGRIRQRLMCEVKLAKVAYVLMCVMRRVFTGISDIMGVRGREGEPL